MPEVDPRALRELAERYVAQREGEVVGEVGRGGSAAVFRVKRGSREFALKVYDPQLFIGPGGPSELRRVQLQRRLVSHACQWLIQVEAIEEAYGTCFISMEYLDWLPVSDVLNRIPGGSLENLVDQLVRAVIFLDDQGMVHRDIKPSNALISPDFSQLRLIDFGVVREMTTIDDRSDATDHGDRRPFLATAQYSSPEYLFRIEEPSPELWRGLTLYQLGAFIHDLVMKRPLFAEEVASANKYRLAMAVLKKVPSLDSKDDAVPARLRSLAAHCLVKDLGRRLRLVRYDDLRRGATTASSALSRRLEQLAASGERKAEVALAEDRKRSLQQGVLRQTIERFRGLTLGMGGGLRVEIPEVTDSAAVRGIRLILPGGVGVVDLCVYVVWDEPDGDAGSLFMRGRLRPEGSDATLEGRGAEVANICANGTQHEETAMAMFVRLQACLNAALEKIETDEYRVVAAFDLC